MRVFAWTQWFNDETWLRKNMIKCKHTHTHTRTYGPANNLTWTFDGLNLILFTQNTRAYKNRHKRTYMSACTNITSSNVQQFLVFNLNLQHSPLVPLCLCYPNVCHTAAAAAVATVVVDFSFLDFFDVDLFFFYSVWLSNDTYTRSRCIGRHFSVCWCTA